MQLLQLSPLNVIAWILVIIFGLPALLGGIGLYFQRRNKEELDALQSIEYRFLTFDTLPWWVRLLLRRNRDELLKLGFREVVVLSRLNLRMLNYSCVLISPDGAVVAPVEYVLMDPLMGVLCTLVMPHRIHQNIFGIFGFALTSVFPDLRRIYTTRAAFLASGQTEGQKEYHVTPKRMPAAEMLLKHREEAAKFGARFAASPRIISTREEYLTYDREAMAKLKKTLEAEQSRVSPA